MDDPDRNSDNLAFTFSSQDYLVREFFGWLSIVSFVIFEISGLKNTEILYIRN
jgi:hypothetical protein